MSRILAGHKHNSPLHLQHQRGYGRMLSFHNLIFKVCRQENYMVKGCEADMPLPHHNIHRNILHSYQSPYSSFLPMCRIVIQRHRCGVDTITDTDYCPESTTDCCTGQRTACGNTSWKEPEGVSCKPCHLNRCFFCIYRWRWRCCHCGTGPIEQQVCGFNDGGRICGHLVCDFCIPSLRDGRPKYARG